MTTFTSPPNQNRLTLNNGDTLIVGPNGVATLILVHAGGEVEIDGGTAVNTILAGGREFVHSGVTNGIEFRQDPSDPHTAAFLSIPITDPSALQGTLTFDRPGPDSEVNSAFIRFDGLGAGITGYSVTPDSFTVDFAEFEGHFTFSVKYPIQVLGGLEGFHIQLAGDNNNEFFIAVEKLPGASPNFSHEAAATIVYTAEFGIAPSATELSGLTQFSQAQFAYGQKIGVDAGIYTFTALGVALASGAQHFQNEFGSGNSAYPNSTAGDAKFVTDAYVNVFGHAGSAAQVQHFVDQLNYYEGLYTAAGVFGNASNVDLLARGAVYGQMLGVEHGIDLGTPVGGTTFTAPPDQHDLILFAGDILDVNKGGSAFFTTINEGGVVNVNDGGRTESTTVNSGGVENINFNGSGDATINAGGVVNVAHRANSSSTILAGGVENLSGHSNQVSIQGGVENVELGGVVEDVNFGAGVLKLAEPGGLSGTISISGLFENLVIDFVNTQVTDVAIAASSEFDFHFVLTLGDHSQISYAAKTVLGTGTIRDFTLTLQPDGQGGTNLIILDQPDAVQSSIGLVGVQHDLAV